LSHLLKHLLYYDTIAPETIIVEIPVNQNYINGCNYRLKGDSFNNLQRMQHANIVVFYIDNEFYVHKIRTAQQGVVDEKDIQSIQWFKKKLILTTLKN
jgi:hypothetical protein